MRRSGLCIFGSRALQTIVFAGICSVSAWGDPTLTLPAANPPTTVLAGGVLTATTVVNNCNIGGGMTAPVCTDTAFVSQTLAQVNSTFLPKSFNGVKPVAANPFTTAYATWVAANNAVAGNVQWAPTIVMGGALDVTITVNQFSATPATTNLGGNGMTISASVAINNPLTYTGPALNQLAWTQVTYDNYFSPSTPAAPATLLDSYSNNGGTGGPPPVGKKANAFNQACIALPVPPANGNPVVIQANPKGRALCDPIYPFQNGSAGFYDQPKGRWSVPSSFRAIALLTSVSVNAMGQDVLTVYNNGINYGFDLKTPEPGFRIFLSMMGVFLVIALSRRRTARN